MNGSGNQLRSGAQPLVLLATPHSVLILRALSTEATPQGALQRESGFPPQTTLRGRLKELLAVKAIAKHRRNRFPGALEYALTSVGEDLLGVTQLIACWLEGSPEGPLPPGGSSANAVVKALADAWSTGLLGGLTSRSRTLTELDQRTSSLSYPAVERRLRALRLAGLIEPHPGNGPGVPYAATRWLRRAAAPLLAAIEWEQVHTREIAAPPTEVDIEVLLRLALPLPKMRKRLRGSLLMTVDGPGQPGEGAKLAVKVAGGSLAYADQLEEKPDAWLLGGTCAWLGALIEDDRAGLEIGGDSAFAGVLLEGLHDSLFGGRARERT